MAVSFQYDEEQQLLLITFEGDLVDADLAHAYRTVRKCAAKYPIKLGILDGVKVTSFGGSAEMVKLMAHHPPMLPEQADRCIVVDQDFLYGMARMYQLLGGESRERLRVVRSMQEAYDYLHVQTPLHLQPVEDRITA